MIKRIWFDGESGKSYTDDQVICEYAQWVKEKMELDGLDYAQRYAENYTFSTWVSCWAYEGFLHEVPLPDGYELKKGSE